MGMKWHLETDAKGHKVTRSCAICNTVPSGKGIAGKLHLDHEHKSGKIRGMLCNNCNRALGLLKDNSEILLRASNYLEGVIAL